MLKEAQNVYFLGVGGIGMSAIARYLNHAGKRVFGYDKTETVLTKTLVSEGIDISYKDDIDLLPDNIDLVIYTPAIPENNKIYSRFRDSSLPMIKRSKALGLICKDKKSIAIAGTHGKTTTSAILSVLLQQLGANNSAFVGGIMNNVKSNFLYGDGDWVVVEADEYDRSFWQLYPDIAIILSMDADHLDIYDSSENVLEGFKTFTSNISEGGSLFIHKDLESRIDKSWSEMLASKSIEVKTFGLGSGDLLARNIRYDDGNQSFTIVDNELEHSLNLQLIGDHNISNALGAISVARKLGYSYVDIKESLQKFKGIHRRFEIVEAVDDVVLVDDYAHHPEELKVAIQAAKSFFNGKSITGIFQPHLFSRTKDFYVDFAKELSELDNVILVGIYPAREKPIPGVSSRMIFDLIDNEKKYLVGKEQILEVLQGLELEIVLVLGAGDIGKEVKIIKSFLFDD